MKSMLNRRPSPSIVVSLVALAVAAAGTATAATLLTGANIKDGSITGKDIKDKSIGSADLKVLGGAKGATGAQGPAGSPGPAGAAGAAGAAGTSVLDASVPTGKSIRGLWGATVTAGAAAEFSQDVVTLQVQAPVPLDTATIKFGVNGANGLANPTFQAATVDGDESGTCSGNYVTPTAPAGTVCVYLRNVSNVAANSLDLSRFTNVAADVQANRLGFRWAMANTAAGTYLAEGVWIYTAP